MIIGLWLLSIAGFVLGATVAPGAVNMGIGLGLVALVFTCANRGLRLR